MVRIALLNAEPFQPWAVGVNVEDLETISVPQAFIMLIVNEFHIVVHGSGGEQEFILSVVVDVLGPDGVAAEGDGFLRGKEFRTHAELAVSEIETVHFDPVAFADAAFGDDARVNAVQVGHGHPLIDGSFIATPGGVRGRTHCRFVFDAVDGRSGGAVEHVEVFRGC